MGDKLPEHMWSTYHTYKAATNYCTNWLVETAADAGYNVSKFLVKSVNCKPGTSAPIVLQTRDFVDLARAVKAASPPVKEPRKVLRKIGLALRARRLCAAWFSGHDGDSETQKRNQTHCHFIEILEQVLEILEPLLTQQDARVKAQYHPPSVVDEQDESSPTNIYDNLVSQTEQLAVEVDVKNSVPSKDPGQPTTREIKIEDLDECNAENAFLAAYCLLADLYRLRAQVRKTWTEYQTGKCSIDYAALMANTAIELVEALEADFYDSTGAERSHEKIFLTDFINRGFQCMEDLQKSPDSKVEEDLQYFLEDPKQFIFHDAWCLALHFMHGVVVKRYKEQSGQDQKLQDKKDAKRAKRAARRMGASNLSPDTKHKSNDHTVPPSASEGVDDLTDVNAGVIEDSVAEVAMHFDEKHIVWLESAYGTSVDHTTSNSHPWSAIEDQTLLKLREVFYTKTIELSTCFAVQVFCDIREIVESDTGRPLADLDVTAREVRVKTGLFEGKNGKRSNIDTSRPRQRAMQIDCSRAWHCEAASLATIILDNESREPDANGFYARSNIRGMLANSPIAAGLYHFELTITMARASCAEVDNTSIITSMLYFYEMIGHMTFMERVWPDLEYLTDFHTAEYLFFGGRPRSAAEAYRKMDLAFGFTLTGKFRNAAGTACGNQRTFYGRSFTLCKMLSGRLMEKHGKLTFRRLEQLQLILSELEKRGTKHRIKMMDCGLLEDGALADLNRWSRNDLKFTATETLERFGKHRKNELKHHRFDYNALENRVASVLKQARLRCEAANIDMEPPVKVLGVTVVQPSPPEAFNRYVRGRMMREHVAPLVGVPGMEAYVARELEAARQKEFMFEALVWAMHDRLEKAERDGVKNLREEVE